MQVKVVNGRVELRKDNGVLIRVVGYSNALYAELHYSNNMLLILSETGKLELRTPEGNIIKEIADSGIKKANFDRDKIVLSTDKSGVIELSLNG
jgi:hypothetical protein